MYKLLNQFIIALFFIVSVSCVQTPKPVFEQAYTPDKNTLTVMTYNVENLFDTEDDANKKDEAYLPLAKKKDSKIQTTCRMNNSLEYRLNECLTKDWSEKILDLKMARLTDVVSKVRGGQGPDILIMEEVENKNVLEIWRTKYLQKMNYKPAILVEGPDERGIDIGVFTRLEMVGNPKLHVIPFKENDKLSSRDIYASRGILEVTLKLDDTSLLTVFGLHFPSQANPTEMRRQAVAFLAELKNALPKDRYVIAAGDFNISSEEEMKTGLISREMTKDWEVSHLVGCKDCKGTYFYNRNRSWSFFDILLMSKNMFTTEGSGWKVLPETVRLENKSVYQTNRYGSPARFDEDRKNGVSDHWPVAVEIMKR